MKQKRYWLRGAGVAIVIYVILFVVLRVVDDLGIVLSLVSPGTWFIIGIGGIDAGTKYTMQFIASAIIWAVLGMIIGWIYEKIKNRSSMV